MSRACKPTRDKPMSYILDALKRADAERGRGAVPGLHARQMTTPAAHSARNRVWLAVGATLALREVLPVARQAAGHADRVRVITSSQLTPEMMKSSDILYVGYLSSLRLLQAAVFERSRFRIGATFDELVDRKTGQTFVSGAGAAPGDNLNRDYGYLAAFRGPAGNRFLVIAGERDIGVMQSAEIATSAKTQAALKPDAAGGLEALYEVDGVGRTNVGAKAVTPRP